MRNMAMFLPCVCFWCLLVFRYAGPPPPSTGAKLVEALPPRRLSGGSTAAGSAAAGTTQAAGAGKGKSSTESNVAQATDGFVDYTDVTGVQSMSHDAAEVSAESCIKDVVNKIMVRRTCGGWLHQYGVTLWVRVGAGWARSRRRADFSKSVDSCTNARAVSRSV